MQPFPHICLAYKRRVQHLSCIHVQSLTPVLHTSAEFNTCLAFKCRVQHLSYTQAQSSKTCLAYKHRFQHLSCIHMQSLTPVLHISAEFNTCLAFKCRVQHLSYIQVQSSYIQVQSSTPVLQTSVELYPPLQQLHSKTLETQCVINVYIIIQQWRPL